MQNTTKVTNQIKVISSSDFQKFEQQCNDFNKEKGASPSQYAPGVFATHFSTTSVTDGATYTVIFSAMIFYREVSQ
jgi:hypothetical protein